MTDPAIHRIPADRADVFAFRIDGRVTEEDFRQMAETMNAAFDAFDTVTMLLIFERFEGRETGAGWDVETVKAQFRSVAKVDKYLVVGAPEGAATMIETMGRIIPVDAQTFERAEEDEAWARAGARPLADR